MEMIRRRLRLALPPVARRILPYRLWRGRTYAYTPEWWNLTDRFRLWLHRVDPADVTEEDFRLPPTDPISVLWMDHVDGRTSIKGPGVHFVYPGESGDVADLFAWWVAIKRKAAERARSYCEVRGIELTEYDRELHTPTEPNG